MYAETKRGPLRTFTIICGSATIFLGVLGLLGWVTTFRILASAGSAYIPMAPDTAIIFVVLGILLLLERPARRTIFTNLQFASAALISIYGLLKFIEYFADADLTFLETIFPLTEKLGKFPIGKMSPITGALFCSAGLAALLGMFRKNRRASNLESGLIAVVVLAGFVAFTGYVYGAPFFYGGEIIPLAVTTALAFLFLGCGLATAAGPEGILLERLVGQSLKARILRSFLPMIIAAVLGQGLLLSLLKEGVRINHALLSGSFALFMVGVMSVAAIAIARNITKAIDIADSERKKTENALRISELRYRRLFESAKDGILILDAKSGEIIDVNPYLLELLGYEQGELLGRKLWEIGPLEFVIRSREAFGVLQAKDFIRYEDLPLETRDGRSISVEFVSNVYLVDERKVIQCNIRDITERKKSDLALRKAEENYRNIFENATNGIFQSSLDGRLLIANPAMSRILGYKNPEELISSLSDIQNQLYVDPIHRKKLNGLLNDFGSVRELESEVFRKDGTRIWISESIRSVCDASGKPSHYEGIIEDITQRKHAEQELRKSEMRLLQAQKMEAIGQLAGGVAHDFNNTLMALSGYTEMLLMKLSNSDPLRKVAEEIQKAVTHGANFTNQLLAFSRKQILSPQVFSLSLCIVQMQDMLRRLIGEDIELTLLIRDEQGFVRADPGQIEQVVMNLAVNGRDAMPQGGKLTIETEEVELDELYCASHSLVVPGHYVMLSVSDTGHGMDESTLSKIFEPFFTTKPQGKGTGLGLSTVYGIVRQSGGHISAYSHPDQGTVFKVYFPRLDEVAKPEAQPAFTQDLIGHGELVLLVDDNAAVREAVAAILRAKGYTVMEAHDGKDALEIFHNHRESIRLLISDIVMPGISGYELAAAVRSVHPEVMILLMSGYTDEAIKRSAYFQPNMAFLQKPCSMTALLKKVHQLLQETCVNKSEPFAV